MKIIKCLCGIISFAIAVSLAMLFMLEHGRNGEIVVLLLLVLTVMNMWPISAYMSQEDK